ncbi:dipeptide epimerase [Geobacillus thermodenitrificans]|uniref:Dipeptide epimerase n=1 Tax=Geobacillus thermodenitrificans TaxID=33940 RepID=A0ABY9QCT0_GEOTD|nr:dipeptide epimerase [Geobacillus thermodenitrificans]ARA98383.1 dipeptide epimerase [Geobacillus thermodenitrificans]PJW20157.1 dipeptide epimerase [Geobacillus thermodenitrificans]WMV76041.1 dipeptide epimerase [Geobacillus thermodenitrificans]
MKIKQINVTTQSIPLVKPFKTALRTVTQIESILVKVTLDNGIEGYGATVPTEAITGETKQSIIGVLQYRLIPVVIGRDIEMIAKNTKDVQTCCVGNTSAKAALDMAMHDALGKHLEIPLYQWFGGKTHDHVNDMTISVNPTEQMIRDAEIAINHGFSVLKIKVGKEAKKDIERIKRIYEAIGPNVVLRIDANQGWTAKEAVRIIRQLEQSNLPIEFIEQPVPKYDIEGLRFIRERVNIPIMADESVFSAHDALTLIRCQAVDLINIKLMKTGGLREAYTIASLAESAGIQCMIGSMMEPTLSVLAAAHLAAAHPNITRVDLDAPLWLDDSNQFPFFQGSEIHLPNSPGIGISYPS